MTQICQFLCIELHNQRIVSGKHIMQMRASVDHSCETYKVSGQCQTDQMTVAVRLDSRNFQNAIKKHADTGDGHARSAHIFTLCNLLGSSNVDQCIQYCLWTRIKSR